MLLRPIITAAFTVGIAVLAATPAAAQAGESGYAPVGKWLVSTVWADNEVFGYCAATINNGKADFRIGTDGRSWQIGTPYYGKKRKVEAYYGFGAAAEVAELSAEGDGWASMPIDRDQLNAFRSAPSFSFAIVNAENTWDLRGAGPAIDKTLECARNRGVPRTVQAAPPPPPAVRTGRNCPAPGSVRSKNSNRALNVTFFNATNMPLDIVWIGFDGTWKKYQTVGPNKVVKQQTYASHPWIAVDARGNCHGGVMIPDPNFRGETPEEQFQIWD
ncbi:MAG: hypothetical protein OEL76_00210 [Siculibacillus sp.]|nr:hypothetical protein [Siculibacillus sp.]